MSKKARVLIGLLIVVIVGGLYYYREHYGIVSTDDAFVQAEAVILSPRVSGYVEQVLVVENQTVKKGDPLIKIDKRDYQNALQKVESEYKSLENKYKEVEINYKRTSGLLKKGAVTQQNLDEAEAQYLELGNKLDSLKSDRAQAELNLQNTEINAPQDGVIAKRSVEVGQLASPGAGLLGFVGSEKRWIVANLKETEIGDVLSGQKVEIDVDSIPQKSFEGKVESLSPSTGATFSLIPPDNATGNYTKVVQRIPVRITLNTTDGKDLELLRAGLSAVVRIHVK